MSPFIYILTTNGLLFLMSIIFLKFPPKKINKWYGYRTHKTMLNQKIWDFANIVFTKNLIIYAGISLLGGLILANFVKTNFTWQPMALVFLSVIVSIIKTEKSLNINFTEEGKKKKTKN
jgi:uncharacterized membrane protein